MSPLKFRLFEQHNSFLSWGAVVFLLCLALWVRVSNLEGKFYWIDEVSSSFVITGHWPEYVEAELAKTSGQIDTIGKFQQTLEQHPDLDMARLTSDLLKRDPQHSPLYFILAQKWAAVFGAKPESLRMVSSLLSFVGIPIFAWLCAELFGSFLFGVIGMGILALAPFHILYSQENREYGFWFTTCALSTALLLVANRKNKKIYWVGYGFSVAICLYTFLFSLPYLISHFLFQWFERKSLKDSRFNRFLLSVTIGCLAYLPWMTNIFLKRQQVEDLNKWSSVYLEPKIYLQGIVLNFSRLFLDFNLPSFKPLPWDQPLMLGSILIVFAIIIVSLVVSARGLSLSRSILLSSMFAVSFLFLFSMDILKGQGVHALVGRQLMPAWIGIYLAVTFAIGIGFQSKFVAKNCLAACCTLVLLVFGAMFSVSYIPQKHWWPLRPQALFDDVIFIESQSPDLLVISEPIQTKQFISLSYSLKPNLLLLALKDQQSVPNIDKMTKIILYRPSHWLIEAFRTKFVLQKATDDIWIGQRGR